MLTVENLYKNYENEQILKNVNLNIKKGEVCAVLGRSGVGKTTLFNILAGFECADSGSIYINGEKLKEGEVCRDMSYMQQKHLLLKHLNVFDNVSLPMKIKKMPKTEIKLKVETVLKEFGLWDIRSKLPCEISGGMQQRVAFLRAYLKSKTLILLDEPFSSLDSITKFEIYNWFENIVKKEKITVLFITHDIQEAILIANKIYIINNNLQESEKTFNIEKNYLNINEFFNSTKFYEYYNKIFNTVLT